MRHPEAWVGHGPRHPITYRSPRTMSEAFGPHCNTALAPMPDKTDRPKLTKALVWAGAIFLGWLAIRAVAGFAARGMQ
jgi:hypothetical protein